MRRISDLFGDTVAAKVNLLSKALYCLKSRSYVGCHLLDVAHRRHANLVLRIFPYIVIFVYSI